MLLKKQTILITGASRGIGKATAELFAKNGANLILISRNNDLLKKISFKIKKEYGSEVHYFKCDVSNNEEVKSVFSELRKLKIKLNTIVNNAGIMKDAVLTMANEKLIKEIYDINVYGSIYVTQHGSKFLIKNRSGSIINMSSIVGRNGNKGQSIYASSKAAIIGFTKSLAKELAPFNVRVNAIAPGFIKTDMTAGMDKKFYELNESMIGMSRMGDPEDVAGVSLFLASDLSCYVTGQVIGVDGSFLI